MKRLSMALGILGLAWATALPASAQQKQITILGQVYNVFCEDRAGAYKNGQQVVFTPTGNRHAVVYFEEGTGGQPHRLWVGSRITGADAEDGTMPKGNQLYVLEGTDANGCFTKAASNMTAYFGGASDRLVGRRPTGIILLNRTNTGVKVDRNLLLLTFQDDDSFRIYDLDTLNNGDDDAIFERLRPGQGVSAGDAGETEADPNLPNATFPTFAHLPTPDGKTILVIGGNATDGNIQLGVWDTTKADALNVLTNLTEITANSPKPLPAVDSEGNALHVHGFARLSGTGNTGEYLVVLSSPDPGGDGTGAKTAIIMARLRITVPDNLTAAAPGSLKAEVLDIQTDLLAKAKDVVYKSEDITGGGGQGIISVTAGPEVSPGKRVLYTTDFNGQLCCLVPVP